MNRKTNLKTSGVSILRVILLLFGIVIPHATTAITDPQIVTALEALEEWELAFPIAYGLAQQHDSYEAWKRLVTQYKTLEPHVMAYIKAWQAAQKRDDEATYYDFLTLKARTPLTQQAIQAIFRKLTQRDQISDYLQFMERFPDTVEALQALLRIQEISFARAQQAGDPALLDAFIKIFPDAPQTLTAIELAYQAELAALRSQLVQADIEKMERLARGLFNEARLAEKADQQWTAARKYRLLNTEAFRQTQAFTEWLDRQDRLDYQKLQLAHQASLTRQLQTMQTAIVKTLEMQSQQFGEKITAALSEHTTRMEIALNTHGQLLSEQLQSINHKMATVDETLKQGFGQTEQQLSILTQEVKTSIKKLVPPKQQRFVEGSSQWDKMLDLAEVLAEFGKELPIPGAEPIADIVQAAVPLIRRVLHGPDPQQAALLH